MSSARVLEVKLNRRGVRDVLTSARVADEIQSIADEIAEDVQGNAHVIENDVPVEVDSYETDRAASAVTMVHAAGLPIEAKYGPLIEAASWSGLDVNEKGGDNV